LFVKYLPKITNMSSETADTKTIAVENVAALISRDFDAILAELATLVRIPSVSWSAFDPAHVQRSSEAVAGLATGLSFFETVNILQSEKSDGTGLGQPAVVARRAATNGRPTVLLYAHHDVQPPGADADWNTTPFEPVIVGDRMFGRGAADDKAGIMSHIASLRALTELAGDVDLGIVLYVEGEEEFGSPSFQNFLSDHRELLASDIIIVADSGNWSETVPALTVSLRGNVTFKLTVRTLDHALHSGMFGGVVPDAMLAMIHLLATLHNADGSVAISGLTSQSPETPEYDEVQLRTESGLLDAISPLGSGTFLNRIWNQPSVTVTGIDAPTVDNASNTLLPEVSVRVSVRVAPGQTAVSAAEAVTTHLLSHAPWGVVPVISDLSTGEPFLADTSGSAAVAARAAMTDAWGITPVDMGVGGSIPFISDFVAVFPEAQILVTGVEDPDSRAHSPNESLHLGAFEKAIVTQALLLLRLNMGE
jgi:acetylornithine deacetylase/succinyl-diaminopimelate desuccinylase-like protein